MLFLHLLIQLIGLLGLQEQQIYFWVHPMGIIPSSLLVIRVQFLLLQMEPTGFLKTLAQPNTLEDCFLKNKINQQVFADSINVIDKPDIIKGMGSQNFDSEGVNSNTLQLIENGILKNYLVDTYNGKKLNLKSNGRSGGTTNLYFEKGNISYEDLMKKNSRSLYITETIGHGSNIVTGDYSVGATGFLVEDGEFKYPVNEITIAGNFKDMFKNIILANDLEFEYSVNSPTMMIEGMTVAGK